MKAVYKYATGESIPDGAIYLNTQIEMIDGIRLVWHYFLIEEKIK